MNSIQTQPKSACNHWAVDVTNYYQAEIDKLVVNHKVGLDHKEGVVKFEMFDRTFFVAVDDVKLVSRLNRLQQVWQRAVAEEYTKQDPKHAFYFAKNCLRNRWPAAEEYIRLDQFWWTKYCTLFNIT